MTDVAPATPAGSTIQAVFQNSGGTQVCPKSSGGTGTVVSLENPVFSPDGTQIAFDQFNYTQTVFTYTAVDDAISPVGNAAVAKMSTEVPVSPPSASSEQPTWGPVEPGVSTPEAPSALRHVVDAGAQGGDVLGVDGREHGDAQLVAAELPVGLGVHDAVGPQDRGHRGGVDGVVEVDGPDHVAAVLAPGRRRAWRSRSCRPRCRGSRPTGRTARPRTRGPRCR